MHLRQKRCLKCILFVCIVTSSFAQKNDYSKLKYKPATLNTTFSGRVIFSGTEETFSAAITHVPHHTNINPSLRPFAFQLELKTLTGLQCYKLNPGEYSFVFSADPYMAQIEPIIKLDNNGDLGRDELGAIGLLRDIFPALPFGSANDSSNNTIYTRPIPIPFGSVVESNVISRLDWSGNSQKSLSLYSTGTQLLILPTGTNYEKVTAKVYVFDAETEKLRSGETLVSCLIGDTKNSYRIVINAN